MLKVIYVLLILSSIGCDTVSEDSRGRLMLGSSMGRNSAGVVKKQGENISRLYTAQVLETAEQVNPVAFYFDPEPEYLVVYKSKPYGVYRKIASLDGLKEFISIDARGSGIHWAKSCTKENFGEDLKVEVNGERVLAFPVGNERILMSDFMTLCQENNVVFSQSSGF